jgi:hypothetical protein
LPVLRQIAALLDQFSQQPITPTATFQFETQLQQFVHELARRILQWQFNHSEPEQSPQPKCSFRGTTYKCARKKTMRKIHTLFGTLNLWRYRYTSSAGLAIFPLEILLGCSAGPATSALAERTAWWAAHFSQREVLALLRRYHNVSFSISSLRVVIFAVSAGLAPERQELQVQRLLEALRKADQSCGRHKPVLAVSRDGINIPMTDGKYHEASCGTVSVYDRRGQRLTTVYLGYMYEFRQTTLSEQMTALLLEVLNRWSGRALRLCYISDGGDAEEDYYRQVLLRMRHPQTKQPLEWLRVADYWHACQYVQKLAEALFPEEKAMQAWSSRMRHLLRDDAKGVQRVLRTAAALRHKRGGLTGERAEKYNQGYGYLQKRIQWMCYAKYKRVGMPIGSGVTEAACKTLFSQRLKLSGMQWGKEGGQAIVNLRVLVLSHIWEDAFSRYLDHQVLPLCPTRPLRDEPNLAIPA